MMLDEYSDETYEAWVSLGKRMKRRDWMAGFDPDKRGAWGFEYLGHPAARAIGTYAWNTGVLGPSPYDRHLYVSAIEMEMQHRQMMAQRPEPGGVSFMGSILGSAFR